MKHEDTAQATPTMSRLPDLETVTLWEGLITNERIRNLLGVRPVYASRLLTALSRHLLGRAMRSTPHAPLEMLYASTVDTQPKSPDKYLSVISSLAPKDPTQDTIFDARLDLSLVSPAVFSCILQATKSKLGVEIEYRSMSSPSGSRRLVFPHTLIRAPRRWHMRAWCAHRAEFRDFTLGRVISVTPTEMKSENLCEDDVKWNQVIELVIGPHPVLGPEHRRMIAGEFFPGASLLKLPVRHCLAPYVIQDLRVAVDCKTQAPPEYQLALLNTEKLELEF